MLEETYFGSLQLETLLSTYKISKIAKIVSELFILQIRYNQEKLNFRFEIRSKIDCLRTEITKKNKISDLN